MKTYLLALAIAAVGIPGVTLAATYLYVDSTYEIAMIEAANADQAIANSVADRHQNSGVVIDEGLLEPGEAAPVVGGGNGTVMLGTGGPSGLITYQYVNMAGEVQFVDAPDAEAALALAVNIHPNSGVVVSEFRPIDPDADVPVK